MIHFADRSVLRKIISINIASYQGYKNVLETQIKKVPIKFLVI